MSKIYKSVFTAQLHTVSLALKFQCVVSVTWRRGKSRVIQEIRLQKSRKKDKFKRESLPLINLLNSNATCPSIPLQRNSKRRKYSLFNTDSIYHFDFQLERQQTGRISDV